MRSKAFNSIYDNEEYQTFLQEVQNNQIYDLKQIKKKKKIILSLMILIVFMSGALTTYFITFFPIYCNQSNKGLSDRVSIWIINSVFFMFPFQEILLSYYGKKKYIIYGLSLCILTNLLLGFIDKIQDTELLIYNGIVSRIIQGVGICMLQTSCYSLICLFFEDQKLQYMGFIQSSIGFGEVIGPFIGSSLFKYYGFLNQFIIIDLIILLIIYFCYKILPQQQKKFNQLIPIEQENDDINYRLLNSKDIMFDFAALCINIFYDNCYIGFLPLVLHNLNPNLDQQTIGLIFALRGLTYVITSLTLPILNIPPKLQNVLGLLLQTISMSLIGTSQLLQIPNKIWIICIGLTLQGFASPFISIQAMPNILDLYQVKYKLHPQIDNRAYAQLCDKISNFLELFYAGFFIFGSFFGEYLNGILGYQKTFDLFFLSGIIFTFIFLFFDCGFNVFKKNQQFRNNLQQMTQKLIQ